MIFFLYRMRDIGLYVSLFALVHSITLLAGVWFGIQINAYVIDAIVGFSVVYKALDNLGAVNIGVELGQVMALSLILIAPVLGPGL